MTERKTPRQPPGDRRVRAVKTGTKAPRPPGGGSGSEECGLPALYEERKRLQRKRRA